MVDVSELKSEEQEVATDEEARKLLQERYRKIADAAFFLAEKRGFAPGEELSDWLAAEEEIDANDGTHYHLGLDIRNFVRELVTFDAGNIGQKIRLLAVRTLSVHGFERKEVQRVLLEIVLGAEDGASEIGERGKQKLNEVIEGLQGALSDVAEAVKFTAGEAQGKIAQFSQREIRQAIQELEALNSLLEDLWRDGSANVTHSTQSTLNALSSHAQAEGKLILSSVNDVLSDMKNQAKSAVHKKSVSVEQSFSDGGIILAGMVSRALRFIANSLDLPNSNDKP